MPSHRATAALAASFLPAIAPAALAASLFALESFRPLRRPVSGRLPRAFRNLAVSLPGMAAMAAVEKPLADRLARSIVKRPQGLTAFLPRALRVPAAVLLMDYTLHLWHILLHRSRLLWRFHSVHHLDRDLDVTTALRFHFGELLLSVPWRLAQIRLIGVEPAALRGWRLLSSCSILFHHSNARLPARLEAALGRIIATPRLHGIHHGIEPAESSSNFSSGLAAWDLLHGTWRNCPPQDSIRIGATGHPGEDGTGVARMLAWPFAFPHCLHPR